MMKYIIAFLLLFAQLSWADEVPRDGTADPRVKTVTYNVRDVITVTAHYGFTTHIEFASYEKIKTVSLGDTLAWNLLDVDNRIFLKPVEDNAETNMVVVTSHRVYNFALQAKQADSHKSKQLTFALKFRYPEDELLAAKKKKDAEEWIDPALTIPDHSFQATDVNMEYSFKGSEDIAPRRVFDDGTFTYFKFTGPELPAIFIVNDDKSEALVNFHKAGEYVVVQRIARQFVLRHGDDDVTCIFNDQYLHDNHESKLSRRNSDDHEHPGFDD